MPGDKSPSTSLHISELVDLAYSIAKEQFGNKLFSFSSIWSKVWKSADRFSREKVENWIGYFYTELSTDPRFIIYSFNNWRLREFVSIKELQKFGKVIFSSEALFEEEYEAYIDSAKGKKTSDVEIIAMDGDDDEMFSVDQSIDEEQEESMEEEREEIFESEEE